MFFASLFAQNQNYMIGLGQTQIMISNNYILEQNASGKYPTIVKKPWKDYVLDVYGENLTIKIYDNIPSKLNLSGWVADSIKSPEYDFKTLEFQIFKNNKIIKDWSKPSSGISFRDESTIGRGIKNAYKIFSDKLMNGDILKVSFRKSGKKPFLNYIIRKKSDDEVPFIVQVWNDSNKGTIENFIQNALINNKIKIDYDFYKDWPSSYHAKFKNPITKVDENSKIAIFFRPKNSVNTKNMLEYRLLENGKSSTENWQKADDLIILSNFKSGKKYLLQVKYAGGKKYIQEEYFSEPKWFQNIWVKIGAGILLATIVGLIFLYFKNLRNKKLHQQQKSKLQFLSAQLNPHFMFNALNSIQGLVNSGNLEKSNKYLTEFSKLMRNIVDFGQKDFIPISQEIKSLNHYIVLEQLRFPFHYEFYLDENIPTEITEVLPMLAQPILENSVKHGVSGLAENGKISLKIFKENSDLIYEICDNGKGFVQNEKTFGSGIKLTKERIEIFNSTSKFVKIIFQTESNPNGTKTKITYKNLLSND